MDLVQKWCEFGISPPSEWLFSFKASFPGAVSALFCGERGFFIPDLLLISGQEINGHSWAGWAVFGLEQKGEIPGE